MRFAFIFKKMIYPKIIFSKLCIFQIIDKKMIYVEGTPLEILVWGGFHIKYPLRMIYVEGPPSSTSFEKIGLGGVPH